MTLDEWKAAALRDAQSRNLPGLVPLIETLARALEALRKAEWVEDASGGARTAKQ
jgi:hypothetical protein